MVSDGIDYCTECGEYIGADKLYQVDQDVFLCWHCLQEWEDVWGDGSGRLHGIGAPDCCEGCRWHESEVGKYEFVDDDMVDAIGCCNTAIESDWCLDEHRAFVHGIYYEPAKKRKLRMVWSCCEYCGIDHRWRWTAWLHGRVWQVRSIGWWVKEKWRHYKTHRAIARQDLPF